MKEIIIVMGIQGSGKSTIVQDYLKQGYIRFNRDEMGGNLEKLNNKLEESIRSGNENFVLDNTYGTKEKRKEVVDIGKKYKIPVKCVWMDTSFEDAQFNVCQRILNKYVFSKSLPYFCVEDILSPNGSKLDKDPCNIPCIAMYAYRKSFQEPTTDEGFLSVAKEKFIRKPYPNDYSNKALILDYDGTLRDTKSGRKYPKDPEDVIILPQRKEILSRYIKNGYIMLGVSNQSGIEKGDITESQAIDCFSRTNDILGIKIDVKFCPHHSFPIRCYCRKPGCGFGVYFINRYKLQPKDCIMVGDSTTDKTFARRCGFQFIDQEEFFK